MAAPSTSHRRAGAWSSPSNGLAARLLAELEDLQPGLRYAITLELRNGSFEPLVVTNHPEIIAELSDASGAPVTPAGLMVSGLVAPEQWGVIPRDAYLGFRIDLQTVGVPTREEGTVLVALGNTGWNVRAGNYVLDATMVIENDDEGPPDQWIGALDLPPVSIEVPETLFAGN